MVPRVSARHGIGRTFFCSFRDCDGQVGGLVVGTVPSRLGFRLRPHPGSQELRALVEAQAPAHAVAWAGWAVPEGFHFDTRSEAWRATRRGGARRRAVRQGVASRRATHGPRPRLAGAEVFAPLIPLPAAVICPSCGRRISVNSPFIDGVFAEIARELNELALRARDDASAYPQWLAGRLQLPADQLEQMPEPLSAEHTVLWQQVLLIAPEVVMLGAAVYQGRPVTCDDFFLVDLTAPLWVAQPDAGHLPPFGSLTRGPAMAGAGPSG